MRATDVQAAVDVIQGAWAERPRFGIVLGTGLGNFAQQIQRAKTIAYERIPGFPRTTALGHRGRWVCGHLAAQPVIAMDGRFHRYEGYSMTQIALPIRVMHALGVEVLILSNASGGVSPRLHGGDIVVIDDHINLMWRNPWTGPDDDPWGSRLADLSAPYDPGLSELALRIGHECGYRVQPGVYAGFVGPNYETRAEYRMLRRIGADVVGMSTVPEVLVAVRAGLRVLALSVVTNVCRPDQLSPTDGAAVLAVAQATEPKLTDLVTQVMLRSASPVSLS